MQEKYFAASNSSEGFCSYYDSVFNIADLNRIYAIKGGSGTGKAFFMKDVAKAAEKRGYSVRYIYCSSDSESLDGIIIKELKIAVLDGTSPHIYEPRLVGAVDSIVDLGAFLDKKALAPRREEITALSKAKQEHFEKAYGYLRAYHELSASIERIITPCINIPKLKKYAKRLANNIGSENGKTEHLLVNSIGMRGKAHFDTYFENANIYYEISDFFETAHVFLDILFSVLREKKVDVRISNNPIIKSRIDTLFLPNKSLCFEISDENHKGARSINMKRFVDSDAVADIRKEYRDILHARNDILNMALLEFEKIKKHHFKLEEIYGSAMNFAAKEKFSEEFCDKVFENN